MSITPQTALFLYKRRWGVETAYSQVHSLDAATKSRNFGIRVFLAGMAFLLFSVWVFVNWDIARHSSIQRNKRSSVLHTVNIQRLKLQSPFFNCV